MSSLCMIAGEPMVPLWDRLDFEIERKIAMLVVASIVAARGDGDDAFILTDPHRHALERSQDLRRLYKLRLMRKSFSTALHPVRLLNKSMKSPDHADAFVTGILLILEQTATRNEMSICFSANIYKTVYNGSGFPEASQFPEPGRKNHSAKYYNALNQNIAAMLQNGQLSSCKFQPGGWRLRLIAKNMFQYLDRFYVPGKPGLANLADMMNSAVSRQPTPQ